MNEKWLAVAVERYAPELPLPYCLRHEKDPLLIEWARFVSGQVLEAWPAPKDQQQLERTGGEEAPPLPPVGAPTVVRAYVAEAVRKRGRRPAAFENAKKAAEMAATEYAVRRGDGAVEAGNVGDGSSAGGDGDRPASASRLAKRRRLVAASAAAAARVPSETRQEQQEEGDVRQMQDGREEQPEQMQSQPEQQLPTMDAAQQAKPQQRQRRRQESSAVPPKSVQEREQQQQQQQQSLQHLLEPSQPAAVTELGLTAYSCAPLATVALSAAGNDSDSSGNSPERWRRRHCSSQPQRDDDGEDSGEEQRDSGVEQRLDDEGGNGPEAALETQPQQQERPGEEACRRFEALLSGLTPYKESITAAAAAAIAAGGCTGGVRGGM